MTKKTIAPALLVAWAAAARADEGSIAGVVRFAGPPPKAGKLAVTKDNAVCGKDRPAEFLLLGKDQGVRNAVVSLEGAPAQAPPPPATVTVDQKGCRYLPHVQAAPAGSTLELRNSDAVLHNVHGYRQSGSTAFNLAMPVPDQRIRQPLRGVGLTSLRCDAGHTWMSAYIWTFDHSYFAVTDGDGKFAIKNVPPGQYKLRVWHEGWRPKRGSAVAIETEPVVVVQAVTVEPGKTSAVGVALK